jgi:hypothetical protein
MRTSVQPHPRNHQMDERRNHNSDEAESFEFADVLHEVFRHGDATNVGIALHVSQQLVNEQILGRRRSALAAVAIMYDTLVRNGNTRADDLIIALARSRGFVCYRADVAASDDGRLAQLLDKVSDTLRAHAAGADGWTVGEHRNAARELDELIEAAASCRDNHRSAIDAATMSRFRGVQAR